jgi:ABC-2 type transport system permease protein
MLYPRALLPHLGPGQNECDGRGRFGFGYITYVLLVRPDCAHFALFVLLTLSVAMLFVGFNLIRGSLAFFVGNAEVLSEQWFFSMITFSTYPSSLFDGWVKLVLYTLIPAGFVSGLPVEALKHFDLTCAALALAGAFAMLLVGIFCFYLGLNHYQSGNLIEMRN